MRLSNEPMHCIWMSAYCLEDKCPYYHDATLQCKIVMAVNRFLGDIDAPKSPAPKRTESHPLIPKSLKPFPKLEPGKYLQEITGEVVDNAEVKEVETQRGPVMIANFNLTDGESQIRVALWEDLVSDAEKFRPGDVITLKGMSIRDPYEGVDQISSTRKTEIL